jgi:hypothetical protein
MPSALTYPGVYVEEISSGVRTITGVATSVTAFIGRALKGPTDEAVTINSFADFERDFGGLWVDSTLGYAVRDFYLNGGSKAVIVRLYHATPAVAEVAADPAAVPPVAAVAAVPAPNTHAAVTIGAVTLEASTAGSWGNTLRAEINTNVSQDVADSLGIAKADLFNLTVRDTKPGGAVETLLNLSVKDNARRIDEVLKEESKLVRWKGTLDTASPPSVATGKDDLLKLEEALANEKKKLTEERRTLADLVSSLPAGDQQIKDQEKKVEDQDKIVVKAQEDLDKAAEAAAASNGLALNKDEDFTPANAATDKKGLYSLEQLFARDGIFNLLCIPPYKNDDIDGTLASDAVAYCESRRAMFVMDPPKAWRDKANALAGISVL